MKLEDDKFCFGCGKLNDVGLKLEFDIDNRNKRIRSRFTPSKNHQGFKDLVHGGLIGLILDECMVNLTWKLGIPSVSAEFSVRLINPAFINKSLDFEARIIRENKRMLTVEGSCVDEDGKNIASSTAKCIKLTEVKDG